MRNQNPPRILDQVVSAEVKNHQKMRNSGENQKSTVHESIRGMDYSQVPVFTQTGDEDENEKISNSGIVELQNTKPPNQPAKEEKTQKKNMNNFLPTIGVINPPRREKKVRFINIRV